MNRMFAVVLFGYAATSFPTVGNASEEQFLNTLDGQYEGQGQVRLRTDKEPINVDCTFRSATSASSLSLKGECRGLLVVSRSVGAELKIDGKSYSGSYVGAGSGTAALSGKRDGNTLNFAIRWAKEVNGDRKANLAVAKIGDRGLTLTTTDQDPSSGQTVVTSEIMLERK